MSTTAENLRELLPSAEPKPPANILPSLPAPPGVAVNNTPDLMTGAPTSAATSQVTPRETTAGQMQELLSASNPYIQQARGSAQRYAASRGLQNSSIAGQGGEQAAIAAALPIASNDAGVYERRELTRVGAENTLGLAREQGNITSQLQQQNANERLIEQAAAGDITSRQMAEQAGFTKQVQEREIANQQWLAQFDSTSRERLQTLDADTRKLMQQLDVDTQNRIANMNVAASSLADAARMASTFELSYSSMLATIMNNPDIPADVRQTYIDHANTVRDSNLALVEQMFAFDLQW